MSDKPKVAKAQPKPLNQAYLILSNNKERFEDRLAIVELFIPETQMRMPEGVTGAEGYKGRLAEILWNTLMDRGFRLNHELEWQYQKQQCCIWCGGQVMTFGNDESWETRCTNCNYLYDED